MEAEYVFRVRFRLETPRGLRVDPQSFETTLFREAAEPGEDGWLFFRDNCWRGELADESHFRELTEDALDVAVESVSFSELRTDQEFLDAFESEIGANLAEFKADTAREVLNKYLGSSIRVVDESE